MPPAPAVDLRRNRAAFEGDISAAAARAGSIRLRRKSQ